ncbi:hypothetical protein U0070_005796 [Myodes glareolus]|uniref:Uncharacterized protein n=1 Tax=Myodes glareolus TaxID=447135 RepID=A0AAW0HJ29_MYOGA
MRGITLSSDYIQPWVRSRLRDTTPVFPLQTEWFFLNARASGAVVSVVLINVLALFLVSDENFSAFPIGMVLAAVLCHLFVLSQNRRSRAQRVSAPNIPRAPGEAATAYFLGDAGRREAEETFVLSTSEASTVMPVFWAMEKDCSMVWDGKDKQLDEAVGLDGADNTAASLHQSRKRSFQGEFVFIRGQQPSGIAVATNGMLLSVPAAMRTLGNVLEYVPSELEYQKRLEFGSGPEGPPQESGWESLRLGFEVLFKEVSRQKRGDQRFDQSTHCRGIDEDEDEDEEEEEEDEDDEDDDDEEDEDEEDEDEDDEYFHTKVIVSWIVVILSNGLNECNPPQECKFTCTSGKCLYLGSLVCNQQNDCGDNSDEENCLLVTEHPPPGIFNFKMRELLECSCLDDWWNVERQDLGIKPGDAPKQVPVMAAVDDLKENRKFVSTLATHDQEFLVQDNQSSPETSPLALMQSRLIAFSLFAASRASPSFRINGDPSSSVATVEEEQRRPKQQGKGQSPDRERWKQSIVSNAEGFDWQVKGYHKLFEVTEQHWLRHKRVVSKPGHHRSVKLINDPVNTSQTIPVGQERKEAKLEGEPDENHVVILLEIGNRQECQNFIWRWMEIETETHIGTLDLTP